MWLRNIVFFCVLFSWQLKAVDFAKMPADIVVHLFAEFVVHNDTDILSLVCKQWHNILLQENFWRIMYENKSSNISKINKEKSFKENYYISYLICHTSDKYVVKNYQSPYLCAYVQCEEIIDETIIDKATFEKRILEALKKMPNVFCTNYYYYNTKLAANLFVQSSGPKELNLDTIMIMPAGNDSKCLFKETMPFDIHNLYPHLLLVATSTTTKDDIAEYSNYGDYVDVAVPATAGTGDSAMLLGLFVAYMRSIRPELRAQEIISIIKKTTIVTPEIKIKLPQGGILNEEEALKALKY